MKLPRLTKILIAVEMLLIVLICLAPTREAAVSGVGLSGPRILLNRLRDFGAVPVSCGLLTVIAGTLFLSGVQNRQMGLPKGRICPLLVGFAAMLIVGMDWAVSAVRLVRAPRMPEGVWLYLVTHRGWFCLWWVAAGCLLLGALYCSKPKPKP